MQKNIFVSIVMALAMVLIVQFLPVAVQAYTIEQLSNVTVEDDYTVGPAQNEVILAPGEETVRNLMVTSRLGKTTKFQIGLEDFRGSKGGESAAVLLGSERGPYSLVDYLKPEVTEFTLNQGERITLPVRISIPVNAEPGGKYGAILVSIINPVELQAKEGEVVGGINVVGRVAALYLVRVKGDVKEDGFLKEIRTTDPHKSIYDQGPVSIELLFQNNGSVHLDLFGTLELKNMFGRKVWGADIETWFAMPDSLRSRIIKIDRSMMFGFYTATAKINRGYNNIVDEKSVSFWILPWRVILAVVIVLTLIILFFRWLLSKFEIKVKK